MTTFHDDFRAMVAELDAKRPRVAAVARPVQQAHAVSYGMSYRATCSLCDAPSPLQVCPRCSAHFAKGGTL